MTAAPSENSYPSMRHCPTAAARVLLHYDLAGNVQRHTVIHVHGGRLDNDPAGL